AFSGSVVNISGGEVGLLFDAESGSEVNISGGTVGDGFQALSGSVVNISGGEVGLLFEAGSGSEVNISGGTVGGVVDALAGSVVNISGGTVGPGFDAFSGSEVNIRGGEVGVNFNALSGSEVNLSGGTVGDDFDAFPDSEVNLFGTEFFLDGVLLDSLVLGEEFTITDRDVDLTGVLADGSAFSFELNPFQVIGVTADSFAPDATLTVTLVEAGDFDSDGDIDVVDALLGQRLGQDLGLASGWANNFGAGSAPLSAVAAVPEPTACLLAQLGIWMLSCRCR
ncbi:MAG: hypothetical protein AAGA92_00645, partial [Planctomycetota bacterium]